MSSRHRIILQTNPATIRTGLAENAKTLLKYLHKTGKYDICHMCTQGTLTNAPQLNLSPWKSYGSIPPDQELVNRINADPIFGRNASYGAVNIDAVVKDYKPTIWIGSDDCWAFPLADYTEKPWYSKIHSIPHITIDSLPVMEQAYEQAKRSKNYLTWAPFAANEMKKRGGASMSHVGSIYGAMDINDFSPIAESDKLNLRKRFNISPDTFVFLFVFRNQLRKQANTILEAFARFKAEHPGVKAALHFHTSFSEKGQGWDLPKMATYYGLKSEELLCTYVCKTCGAWAVAPYAGEDLKCPVCGDEKGLITANIVTGVPGNQMKMIYGISDAVLSCFTSGGQELNSCQGLLCGKPLACTDYSCGQDFCLPGVTDKFVYPVKWHPTHEAGSNFIKATNDVSSIAAFMRKVVRQSKRDLQEVGERGRDWAVRTFGIDAIGAQWEKLFSTLPANLDWSSVDLSAPPVKNPGYKAAEGLDDVTWLKTIYKGILLMEVQDNDEGLKHWTDKLKAGITRQSIQEYFVKVANEENIKHGAAQVDFGSLLDNRKGRRRCLFVMKESLGDVAMVTSLFESLHQQHPNTDLYVATDPKYAGILAGNEHIYKVLPYIAAMEGELAMIGQGKGVKYFDYYYHPGITTQRQLSYLSNPEPAFDVVLH